MDNWCDCARCNKKGFYSIWTHPDYNPICTNCANELKINPLRKSTEEN